MVINRLYQCVLFATFLSATASAQNVGVTSGSAVAGIMLNQTFFTGPGPEHQFLIASLPPSGAGSYDHLHLVVTVNSTWASMSNSYIDAAFANRNGFSYQYALRGSSAANGARLVAYQNAAGGVDIYLDFNPSAFGTGTYSVLENIGDTVYPSPKDVGAGAQGTLIFDSSSSAYPPTTFADNSGNFSIEGALSLKGRGSSVTFYDNSIQSTAWTGVLAGGDYAESVDVIGDRTQYEPGDVLVIDPKNSGRFLKSSQSYSTAVMGIYSTNPGVVGRRQKSDKSHMKDEVPMAMVGVVPTKVTAEGGPIRPGDLLVTSSKPGYAMRGTDHSQMMGAIIGKALDRLDAGTGVIEVAVSLQ